MSRPRILITRRLLPALEADLKSLATQAELITNPDDAIWSPTVLKQKLAGVDAVVATLTEKFDAALLAACPQLKLIANIAVGYNNIDLAACRAQGITVTNTPDVLTESTADHAWALLMATARRVAEGDRYIRAGQWQPNKPWALDMLLGADIYQRTLGILGMGRIGAAIARRAQGFQMRVQYHNRRPVAELKSELGSALAPHYVDFETLLRTSDFLVLVVPYSAATHHLIDAHALRHMSAHAILINIARGGVVDEPALIEALRTRQLAGAGLDVFEGEPSVHPDFLGLENVVLTPHIGSATQATRQAMARLALANVQDWLHGVAPRTAVLEA